MRRILCTALILALSLQSCNSLPKLQNGLTNKQIQSSSSVGGVILNIDLVSGAFGTYQLVGHKGDTYYALTAYHVIAQKIQTKKATMFNLNGQQLQICIYDKAHDWALLKFKSKQDKHILKIAYSKVGQEALAIGFISQDILLSGSYYKTYWKGHVVSTDINGCIIFNGGILPGNSGGPLLNNDCQVIGLLSRMKSAFNLPCPTAALFVSSVVFKQKVQNYIQNDK